MRDEPLYMPKGSVRALLAIGILLCTIILIVTDSSFSGEFMAMTSLIIGYYFGVRKK